LLIFIEIGQSLTDPNDQKILKDWYNSLELTGYLNWDGIDDLCQFAFGQISCDSSTQFYKRVTELYWLSFLFLFFSFIK